MIKNEVWQTLGDFSQRIEIRLTSKEVDNLIEKNSIYRHTVKRKTFGLFEDL